MKEKIEHYIAAYNRMDVSVMLALLSDNIIFENVSNTSESTMSLGKTELEAIARQSLMIFSSRQQTIRSLTLGDATAAAEIDFVATLAVSLRAGQRPGEVISLRGVTIFASTGGKISRISDYS